MPKKSVAGDSVSFFFPAYFDEKSLPGVVSDFHGALRETGRDFEIVIIDDGCPDRTGEVADALAKKFGKVRAMHHKKNMGYGATLDDGFSGARKELVGFTDGDAQYSAGDLRLFLDAMGDADIVFGYRRHRAEGGRRALFQRCYKIVFFLLFGVAVRDTDCSFKMMRSSVYRKIRPKSRGGFYSAELVWRAKKNRLRVREVPVRHFKRPYGSSTFFGMKRILHLGAEMLRVRLGG